MPGAIGGALLVAGGTFGFLASGMAADLRGPPQGASALSHETAAALHATGKRYESLAAIGLALGAAGVGASAVWFALTGSSARAAVAVTTSGAAVTLSGTWP